MKKCLFSLGSVLFIFLAAAQTPVAYYPFTGNANDAIGTNHGTVNGATLTTDRFGNASRAYSFDGVNDKITAPIATTATNNFSLTGWIKVNSIGTDQVLFYNGNSSLNGYGFYLSTTGTLYVFHGGINLYSTSFVVTANQWIFLSMVQQSGNTKVYVNGLEVFSNATSTPNAPGDLFYMSSNSTGTEYFNGSMDEIKIFTSALTAAQVQQEYNPNNYSSTFGNSVKMNGVNDYIQPPAVLNGATQFTIEYWIKSTESRTNGTFSQNPTMIGNEVPGASSGEFSIYSSNGFIGMWGELNSGTQNFVSSSTKINDNRWHHIAAVNNGTNVILYVDGISVGSIPSGNGIATSGNPLRIGANNPASIGLVPHQGYFDEVRFWNIARTQAELIASMNVPLSGTETGLEGYWDMNRNGQGAGLTVDNKCVVTGAALNGTTVGTASTPVFELGVTQLKPGSGNAISFDGVDDNISMTTAGYTNIQTYTIECWLKKNAANLTSHIWESNALSAPSLESNGNNNFNFFVGGSNLISTGNLTVGKWYHIACVYDKANTLQQLYVNGVLMGSNTVNVTDVLGANIGFGERLFGTPNNRFFNGELDEIRIWNTALSQTQIRDRMCRKITSSDALYSNLVAYYNFDEGAGTTAFDGTVNANNGTLANSPTRVTSGAAIGTASTHDYVNATKTASLAHASGESFTVTSTSGNPDGIHVYRVDEQPNTLTGASGVGSNDKYFGVFQVNGTAPQYTAVYNYNGNPFVTPSIEYDLRLNKRTDNAAASWTLIAAVPDEPANTITTTGESTEYILGRLTGSLPLNLISFTGSRQNNDALLQWKTANEINVSRFEVQRSEDGVSFKTFITLPAGSNDYSISDPGIFKTKTLVFYRLKYVDRNGRFTYSASIKLSALYSEALAVFPNPVQDAVTISGLKQNGVLQLYSTEGKLLLQQTVRAQSAIIDMRAYAKGVYLIQYLHNGTVVSQKIVKQ